MKSRYPKYLKILRIGAVLTSLAIWYVSVRFSVEGFKINLSDLAWIGIILAIGVTILQLVFNKGVFNNPTLFVAGILAYLYGIITNIIGILYAQELVADVFTNLESIPDVLFAIVLSLVIEIVPEALLLWALFPENKDSGDFVSSLVSGTKLNPNQHNLKQSPYKFTPPTKKPRQSRKKR